MINSSFLFIVNVQLYAQHINKKQRFVDFINDQYYFLNVYIYYLINLLLIFSQTNTNENLTIILNYNFL